MPSTFDQTVRCAIARRKLFVTETGIVGLGPLSIQPGDHIYLLPGAKTPFVLRRVDNCFKVIGDCYAQGLMNGGAMLEWRDVFLASKCKNSRTELQKGLNSRSTSLKMVKNALGIWKRERTMQTIKADFTWAKDWVYLV